MGTVKNFKIDVKGHRVINVKLETRGLSESKIDKALDVIVMEFKCGENVENCIHYF